MSNEAPSTSTAAQTQQPSHPAAMSLAPSRLDAMREQCVREHPASAALVTFALGFGTGLGLVALLIGEQKKQVPEGLAQRLGQQVLDSLSQVLPESVVDRMHR